MPPDRYIVCPTCDAAYELVRPKHDEQAICARCHTVLITPKRKAGTQIIALACAVCILVTAAMFMPFLAIKAGGMTNSISILGTAFAFDGGIYEPLVLAMIALIIVIPVARALGLIYVLTPLVLERPIPPGAKRIFGWAEALRPWSMVEIFVLGCAVALIKVADLADIWFGPAFWLFSMLVLVVIAQDSFMCRWSVWNALIHPRKP
ncbi:paraquat-inducible protein A [Primorskyibacter sp. S187A]|uniref:paraquat-inducible protein A n=1 Tax=Primorskyibacter sp. S187A TaxID=3415130 RepID=UPI003C7B6BBC